jgi:formamidopyrimidine-DNA glycosylase
MPELPEVETIRRDLEPYLVGRTITAAHIHSGAERLAITHAPCQLEQELCGQLINKLSRHGKYLIASLSDGRSWVIHLRMTGMLLIGSRHAATERFERARVELDNDTALFFNDIRKFGTWHLVDNPYDAMPNIGPDILSKKFSIASLSKALSRRSAPIKSVLLDQRVAAGIGNIYADEALWIAKIHPRTSANKIGPRRVARLHKSIIKALCDGLSDRGSSFDVYRDAFGKSGGHHLNVHVFRRHDEPCERKNCEGHIISRIRLAGRATHFCGKCQRR